MSGSDWYLSDESGRALVELAAGGQPQPDLLAAPEITQLAYRHGLVVPAARGLGRSRPHGQYLAAVAARMAARHTCIDGHLRRILSNLAEGGVRASVVKGPAIARLYRDPSIRTYTDVDVVVPADDLGAALEALKAYEWIGGVPVKVPAADKRDIVVRDPSGVQFSVDLHWDLFSFHQLGGSARAAMEEAWQRATFNPDHPVGSSWELPDEAVFAFLGLHALLDHRFRLILFRDLVEVAEQDPDWQRMAVFAEGHGLASLQYLAWRIAAEAAGAKAPQEFLDRLRQGSWSERLAEHYLARVDLVRFNGHRVHPLNLAITQIHDDQIHRRRLLMRAPLAYRGWRTRVQVSPSGDPVSVDVLVTSNARRGAEVFGRHLTDQLVLRGWDVSLVSLRGGDSPGVASTPVVGERVDLRGLRPKVVARLRRRLRTHKASVVFVNGGATLRYAVAASLLVRPRPRLVYGSIGEPGFWLRGPLHRWWQRLLIALCHDVTAVSQATGRALEEDLGIPAEKISIVHLGVDESWFGVAPRDHPEGPMRVLYAGRLSFEKDPLTAIRAVVALGDDAVLRMAGDGPLRADLEREATSQIEILGAVDDVVAQMEWADVLLLTSRTEGLPGVVVEASAAGLPVVASDVGGTAEIVIHGETGLLVAPEDVEGFSAALRTLADDLGLRLKLGEAGRERARQRFRLKDTIDAYESVLRRAATR